MQQTRYRKLEQTRGNRWPRLQAVDLAHQDKVSSLEKHILVARHRLDEKFTQSQTLRKQVADLSAQLATLRRDTQTLAANPPPSLQAKLSPSEQHGNFVLPQVRAAPDSSQDRKPPHVPTASSPLPDDASEGPSCSTSRPCSLFSSGPPLYRFEHYLSVSRVGSDKPYWEGLTAYRSKLCQERGCRVDDIQWLLEVELHPELTRHGPITSTLQTPECSAKFTALWIFHLLEMAALLTISKRLQKLRADAGAAHPLPTVILAHDSLPSSDASRDTCPPLDHLPHPAASSSGADTLEGSGSCYSAVHTDPASAASVGSGFLHDVLSHEGHSVSSVNGAEADASATPPWAFDHVSPREHPAAASAGTHGPQPAGLESLILNMQTMLVTDVHRQPRRAWAPDRVCGTWEALKQCIRGVIARIFAEYVPWMRPVDVLQLCRRLHSSFGGSVPPKEEPGQPLTRAAAFAGVITALNDVTQAVAMDVRTKPRAPHSPSTIEEIDQAIIATNARMHAVNFEWNLLYNTVCVDSTSKIRSLTQWVNPVTLGYAEYEKLNMVAWNMLDLSKEQKVSMAAVWRRLQQQYKQNLAEFRDTARKLLFFPSAADLAVHDSAAFLRFANELHKHHQSLVSKTSHADDVPSEHGSMRQPAEHDPYEATKQFLREPWRTAPAALQQAAAGEASSQAGAGSEQTAWLQGLLGVSPDATHAAGRLLCHLKDVLGRQNSIFLDFNCGFLHVFTMEQEALYVTGMMPFYADAFRIAGMARTDVCCQQVYGRPAICW